MRLKDKTAIITGGSQGIGEAYAMAFANEGASVVIADTDLEKANQAVETIQSAGGKALAVRTDVSVLEETERMAEKAIERFGRIDALVCNAAIFGKIPITRAPFDEIDLSEWDRSWNVNVKGVFLCCRAVFPAMKAQESGKIITVSSNMFFRGGTPYLKYAHYVAQKGAIIGLTRALARELGEYKINVNCIAPGGTMTEDPNDPVALSKRQKAAERRSIRRIEYPEDLVGAAIFLASSESDFITGQTIVVDGGDVML